MHLRPNLVSISFLCQVLQLYCQTELSDLYKFVAPLNADDDCDTTEREDHDEAEKSAFQAQKSSLRTKYLGFLGRRPPPYLGLSHNNIQVSYPLSLFDIDTQDLCPDDDDLLIEMMTKISAIKTFPPESKRGEILNTFPHELTSIKCLTARVRNTFRQHQN